MKTLLLFCFLSFNSMVFARQTQWNEGVVVLKGAEVQQGDISVDVRFDLILFRRGDSVMVYPAHRIQSFYYYDASANINRRFISLQNQNNVFREYHLYEVVLRGDVSVLRKQKGEIVSNENPDRLNYNYFVKMADVITTLAEFRKKVYPELLKVSHNSLLEFVHREHINPNHADDAIRIIKFYNAGVKQDFFAKVD